MIGWLTGASGGTLLAVAVPLALLVTGGSYIKGRMDGYSLCEAKALEAGLNLDKISGEVSINIADAMNSYKQGYDARNSNIVKVNTDAIEAAALKIGKLEGQAEGYKKGFEDAAAIENTCYNDPDFLSDSLRHGAESRYEAIFGGAELAGKPSPAPTVSDSAGNPARIDEEAR